MATLAPRMSGSARLAQRLARDLAAALLLTSAVVSVGCGGAQTQTVSAARPIDERRAIEIIRRAIKEDGGAPAPAREVELLKNGASIRIDVGIRGREYGIAFVTREEASALRGSIPPRNLRDERLPLAKAGERGRVRVLLLYQENYVFDDLVGETHEQTAIAAEQALARDVQDFISYARSRKLR